MDIRGFVPTSLNEWHGKISSIIFTQSCNWRCPYCHGWRFVKDQMPQINIDEIYNYLDKNINWIDGIVITGGEPTLQKDLKSFINIMKEQGFKVKLETNGSQYEVISDIINHIDCISVDYKTSLDKLENITHADIGGFEQTIDMLKEINIEKEYHTTLWPQCINVDTITDIGNSLNNDGKWFLQQFRNSDCMEDTTIVGKPFSQSSITALYHTALSMHENVVLTGF